MEKIRLVVVDDHTILRESLVNTLAEEKDFEIVGHWSTGEESVEFLKEHDFDIAILDNRLPGISGIETTRLLKDIKPSVSTIILTMYSCEREVLTALTAGAYGYLPKENSVSELVAAIRSVIQGSFVLGSSIMKSLLKFHAGRSMPVPDPQILTQEEKMILYFAASGYANKEIGERLGISLGLVKFRFHEILQKLDARDRTNAVIQALKKGLITLEES